MAAAAPPTNPLPLLEALLRCPSVTPEEAGALSTLENFLAPFGFQCMRLRFGEVDNLFARLGTADPHLCFAGHTDVVPPGPLEDWSHPPFAGLTSGGFIFGRGAADMKGSIAAFTAAAIDFAKACNGAPPGSLSFLITGDEEGPAVDGTVKVLQWMQENGHIPTHCIVGEPTSSEVAGDTIKFGRRGSMSFSVLSEGVQGHVAYPQRAENAVHRLARLVDRLASRRLDAGNQYFEPSTLSVTSFDTGNPTANVIPSRAEARFNIRFNTEHTFETLAQWVEEQAAEVAAETGGRFSFESVAGADAFITNPGEFLDMVQEAIAEETGIIPQYSTGGGTSDARFIKDYCPVLELGPSNATVHQANERIAVTELRSLTRIYRNIVQKYFGL